MRRRFSKLFVGGAAVVALVLAGPLRAQDTQEETEVVPVAPIAHAYELAGAFANDGFKLRDGHWEGTPTSEHNMIAVTLYAGNSYWFCIASSIGSEVNAIGVYDEKGEPMEGELFQDGHRAAFGMTAPHSGRYFVRLESTADTASPEICFLYLYK